jgi:hypothetical protein
LELKNMFPGRLHLFLVQNETMKRGKDGWSWFSMLSKWITSFSLHPTTLSSAVPQPCCSASFQNCLLKCKKIWSFCCCLVSRNRFVIFSSSHTERERELLAAPLGPHPTSLQRSAQAPYY